MKRTADALRSRVADGHEAVPARRGRPLPRRTGGRGRPRGATLRWRASLALATALVAASAGAAPVLRNPEPIPIPLASVSFLLDADLNADGHGDLLLVDPGRSVAVRLDNGTSPFAAPVVTALPSRTARPGIGDVNDDGTPDLVVTDSATTTLVVMLGNGDGSFSAGVSSSMVAAPGPIALADLNADGWLDVAVASTNTSSTTNVVAVYFGDGTGHLTSGPTTPIGSLAPPVLAPVDMNLDGKMDLVASAPFGPTQILLGDGLGGLTPAGTMVGGDEIAIGDFNHDGNPDLAAVPRGSCVVVGLGNGDGTLLSTTSYDAGYDSSAVVGADVDEDGNLDLLVTGTAGSEVAVLRGNPDGTFRPAELFVSGPSTWKIVAGDYDRDGHVDFVTLDYNAQQVWALSCVRGHGDGRFETYRAFSAGPAAAASYANYVGGGAVADMNHDGKPDVIVIQQRDTSTLECDLGVMLNTGHGNLASPILSPSGERSWSGHPAFAVGDVDGDGTLDAVVVSNFAYTPSASTLLGTGDGHFSAPIPLSIAAAGRPALGHFTSGTNLDLLITAGHEVAVYPGNGDGAFGTGIVSSLPDYAQTVAVGDLNGDGKLDFVCNSTLSVRACLNDGTGRFSCSPVASRETYEMALADLDGDGTLDVLVKTSGGTEVRPGTGTGTFGPPVSFTMSPAGGVSSWTPAPTADFDGDGHVDVALGTTIYLGNGDGTFRSRATFRTVGATETGAADMDGSGSPDLVVVKSSADAVDVLLTRTSPDPTAEASITLALDPVAPVYGQSVTLTATVTGGALALGGAVRFTVDGHDLALVDVAHDGTASYSTAIAVGSHTVGVTYTGDEYYQEATTSLALEVAKAPTAVSISGSPNPQVPGRTVTVHVSASPTTGGGVPTGTLALRDGDTPLPVQVVDGWAQLTGLALGAHVISADYPGDANFMPSTSSYTQLMCVTPDATIDAPIDVAAASGGNLASVRDAGPGATYVWSITNADITSGQGTPTITFTAGAAGSIQLSVVVQTPGGCERGGLATVAILPFQPDQALADGVAYPLTDLHPSTLAIGDLDGDGRDDLAIGGGPLIVMLQQGDGTLGTPVVYPSSGVQAIAIGDLNGDGRADIATAGTWPSCGVTVFAQQTDGSFVPSALETEWCPYQVAAGDVTHDGRTDLVAMPWASNTDALYVFEQQADGTLVRRDWTISGGGYDCMRLAQVNGDGLLDLMVVSPQAGPRVAMRFGDPALGFGDEVLIPLPWTDSPSAVATGDFSGEGRVDLAVANDDSIGLLLQDTDGGFSAGQTLPVLPWPDAVVSSDLDHDGRADLATIGFEGPNHFVQGWLQGPVGAFRAEKYLMPSVFSNYHNNGQMAAGDLNGDGRTDLAVALDGGALAVFYGARVMPIAAPAVVDSGATDVVASVPDAGRGATYTWTIANGTITGGSGTRSIVFTAGVSGAVELGVTVQSRTRSTSNGARSVAISRIPGDVNGDGSVTVADVFHLINFLFVGGAPPMGSGDVNGDGQVTVADALYLVNHLFAGGPAPTGAT